MPYPAKCVYWNARRVADLVRPHRRIGNLVQGLVACDRRPVGSWLELHFRFLNAQQRALLYHPIDCKLPASAAVAKGTLLIALDGIVLPIGVWNRYGVFATYMAAPELYAFAEPISRISS